VSHGLFFDEFEVGQKFTTPSATLTESQIVDFAMVYDPQPFHISATRAEAGPYGGLIASGFQSMALCFRLFLMTNTMAESSMGSPGIEKLRWLKPVRPGDTLYAEVEVLETRASQSKPDRGIVRFRFTLLRGEEEPVLDYETPIMIARAVS